MSVLPFESAEPVTLITVHRPTVWNKGHGVFFSTFTADDFVPFWKSHHHPPRMTRLKLDSLVESVHEACPVEDRVDRFWLVFCGFDVFGGDFA
jgi:hypothetical protein